MDVDSISVQFVPTEDRLLLRVAASDGGQVSAWLTRRLMLGLWKPLDRLVSHGEMALAHPEAIVHPAAHDMLAAAAREQVLARVQDHTEVSPASEGPAIEDDPLLVTQVKLMPRTHGDIGITWSDRGGSEMAMNLDATTASALLDMLRQAMGQSEWGLSLADDDDDDDEPDLADDPAPPGSLLN